jgi:predicted metal-dependent peptidase
MQIVTKNSHTSLDDGHRLRDPQGLLAGDPERLSRLRKKLSDGLAKIALNPNQGGNPFLFSFIFAKPHYLVDHRPDQPKEKKNFHTAATNGKAFFWYPDFLEQLNEIELQIILSHETYHVILDHSKRMIGKNRKIMNIVLDYHVNYMVDRDSVGWRYYSHLWTQPNFGEKFTYQEFINWLDGATDHLPQPFMLVDLTIQNRSVHEMYDEMLNHHENSPRKCKTCNDLTLDRFGQPQAKQPFEPDTCPGCGMPPGDDDGDGNGFDQHMPSELTEKELQEQLTRAANQARMMQGTVPSAIEEALKELENPQLRPSDLIRSTRQVNKIKQGQLRDYKRISRRSLARPDYQLQFKTKDYKSDWIAMIDTSGSMSDADIANGIKELKLVGDSSGWIVPCDASPKWDNMTRVTATDDIKRTKIVGRGGTVFDDFFRDLRDLPIFPQGSYDTVIIITDGDCGNIDPALHPRCDVVWVITNQREFTPPFGRVCYLKSAAE